MYSRFLTEDLVIAKSRSAEFGLASCSYLRTLRAPASPARAMRAVCEQHQHLNCILYIIYNFIK